MSCLEIRVRGPEFSNRPSPSWPHSRRLGVLSIPQSLPTAEGSPLRRSAPSPALLRGRHRRLPRFENRGRPDPHGSPSAPRPMGCRFGGTSLGEIDSPSWGEPPRVANLRGIGDLADAAGFGGGVSNPAPPTHHHRPARRWALPSPFEAVPTAFSRLPLLLPPLRGGGWVEIAPSPAFRVPRLVGSGNPGGSSGSEREPISQLRSTGGPPLGPSRSLQAPLV